MPAHAGREEIAFDRDVRLETADQRTGVGRGGQEFRDRFAVLRDHQAFGADLVEKRQAARFELCGGDAFHLRHDTYIQIMYPVTTVVWRLHQRSVASHRPRFWQIILYTPGPTCR